MRENDILYIKQRKVMHWTVLLMILLVFTVCLRMRITGVVVQGNDRYTAQQAEDMVFSDYWDRNTVVCVFRNLTHRKKSLPFVEDYRIVLTGPFSCELRFYEKKPIGCISYVSNYMYFDKDGIVIESSPVRLEGIPVVEGIDFGYIVLGKKLPVDSRQLLNSIMSVTQQLSLFGISCDLIKYSSSDATVSAVLDGGNIEVLLGGEDYLAAKISVLNDMLPEIRERGYVCTLNLSNYDDRSGKSVITLKLREDTPETEGDARAGDGLGG